MKTLLEVTDWRARAFDAFGDPARPVCQLFARWHDKIIGYAGEEVAVGYLGDDLVLLIAPDLPLILQIEDEPRVVDGQLVAFGAEQIADGLWSLNPSLNASGVIHAFVTLYGVPDPAPWQRRILVPR